MFFESLIKLRGKSEVTKEELDLVEKDAYEIAKDKVFHVIVDAEKATLHAIENAEKAAVHAIEDEVDTLFHDLADHKNPDQESEEETKNIRQKIEDEESNTIKTGCEIPWKKTLDELYEEMYWRGL